jgi:hypothetical protein
MDLFPKFIIEDRTLVFGKVTYHKHLATDITNVIGGGWFRYDKDSDAIIFYGKSEDFGEAYFKDIKDCIERGMVFHHEDNVSEKHSYGYNSGSEITMIKNKHKVS